MITIATKEDEEANYFEFRNSYALSSLWPKYVVNMNTLFSFIFNYKEKNTLFGLSYVQPFSF